ncbi:hypothetical protein PRIPAC_87504 [Pristionchus pacificus]|uniref:Tyrosine phosphatase n=1 Tax=Pristionchus pacificus TaxID=54126 RepID=A0A2A6B6K6_PRIPA|nr:hypothetical protein PRIPAC_87504 [Pristionchus pacificus]|eukprot:PDM61483.1 tyrosine phosphatase [Pristionchus pacificus]
MPPSLIRIHSSLPPSSLSSIGWRAMKKLTQSVKRLSLKSGKSSSKSPARSPVTPPTTTSRRRRDTDLRGPYAKCYRRRRVRRPDDVHRKPELEPVKGWANTAAWDPEAAKVADCFMDHYAAIGLEGIKEEFRREIERFSSPTYGDVAFKANPTKNRDKNIMACLDDSRVELTDGRYVNASWVFDKKRLGRKKYILTQEPTRDTAGDFWEMCHEHGVSCIIVFSESDFVQWKEGPHLETRRLNCTELFLAHISKSEWSPNKLMKLIHDIALVEAHRASKGFQLGPILLMDDYSATSRAAVLAAVDILGQLMYQGEKHVTVHAVLKWLRSCRHYAISRSGRNWGIRCHRLVDIREEFLEHRGCKMAVEVFFCDNNVLVGRFHFHFEMLIVHVLMNEDDYTFIVQTLFNELVGKYARNSFHKEVIKHSESYRQKFDAVFGKKGGEAKGKKEEGVKDKE